MDRQQVGGCSTLSADGPAGLATPADLNAYITVRLV